MPPVVTVYRSVSGHISALVSSHSHAQHPRRRQALSLHERKRTRGLSDEESLAMASSSYGSSVGVVDEPSPVLEEPPTTQPRPRVRHVDLDDDASPSIRAEQGVCAHCRALFFVALAASAPFCSLDCRTCFHMQGELEQSSLQPWDSFLTRATLSCGRIDNDGGDDEPAWLSRDDQ